MDLIVEQWPLSRLREYQNNPRKNDLALVDRMVAAFKEFGFRIPIVARSNGEICDGHLRFRAATKMGLETVPVALADGLSDAQIKAFRIWANKSASLAEWDDNFLRMEFQGLGDLGYDIGLTGFSFSEISELNAKGQTARADPDDAPEVPTAATSVAGDVWLLGGHRLACGDSTNATDVERLLAGAQPHLMVTDPPYGVEYDADWRNRRMRSDGTAIGGRAIGKVQNDDKADWREAWTLFPGDVAYVWHAILQTKPALESLEASGFQVRSQIIWAKNQFAIGRGDYHFQHEPCWYAVRKGKTGRFIGGRKQSTLWQIDKPQKSETGHSTQKPVECMRRPIENNSKPWDAVYEPFSGSGTTIIAAQMTGRRCFAMELHPAYVDLAVLRWQTFSGQTATLEASGLTFEEVKAERPES